MFGISAAAQQPFMGAILLFAIRKKCKEAKTTGKKIFTCLHSVVNAKL
jgi:hypothetical protein